MKFTFSKQFRTSDYQSLLHEVGGQLDDLRLFSGCSVKQIMADVHIGHERLKKCSMASRHTSFII